MGCWCVCPSIFYLPLVGLCLLPLVQAEMGALGGVELVLAQCQLDWASPLAREWALWGVRNLCEGNPAAQVGVVVEWSGVE